MLKIRLKRRNAMPYLAIILLFAMNPPALADGFRCGTRLVLTGDPVSRLNQACGQPEERIKAHVDVQENGRQRSVSVTQWVYQRRGKKPMLVSVRNGRVVRIDRG
jgi:hypothetical protein